MVTTAGDILAEYTIKLNTDAAKTDLRELYRLQKQAQRKSWIADSRRSKVGGIAAQHFAGAVGGRMTLSRAQDIFSHESNPWDHAMIPAKAAIVKFIDEQIGYSNIAKRRARLHTYEKLADVYAGTKDLSSYKQYEGMIRDIYTQEENGREVYRRDETLRGPSFEKIMDQAVKGYIDLIQSSYRHIVQGLMHGVGNVLSVIVPEDNSGSNQLLRQSHKAHNK